MALSKYIDVNTGEVKTSKKTPLGVAAIGSCIIITSYDPQNKVGAIAHIMLPGRSPDNNSEKTKYAQDAIDQLLQTMKNAGSDPSDLEICLVGAGNVLEKHDDTICEDNINSITEILKAKKIKPKASILGGIKRKGVVLDVKNGTVYYTIGNSNKKLLWKSKHYL